ncbi:MAG: hypothetical protein WCO61_05570 [Alphaproteobacteria bacterium]
MAFVVSTFILALYLALLVLALIRRGKNLTSRWLFLLRGFFPSWRFFDSPGYQPRLFVRALLTNEQWSDWVQFIPRASFKLSDLFFNPQNNIRMTEQTLIDHLCLDLQALPETQSAGSLVSYMLTENIAGDFILRHVNESEIKAYQFEIRMLPGLNLEDSESVVLVSPIIHETLHVF